MGNGRTFNYPAINCEPASVARAIPCLLNRVPVYDTFHVCAGGRNCVDPAGFVLIDCHLLSTALYYFALPGHYFLQRFCINIPGCILNVLDDIVNIFLKEFLE